MRILGIDYGDKRIGIAVSDIMGVIASPVEIYLSQTMRKDIDYIAAKCVELKAEKIVLGLPLNMDGTEGERSNKTRAFGRNLMKVSGLEVVYKDERLSTITAEKILIEGNMRREKRKQVIDSLAAQIILQSYLDIK